jgi:uncharacterized OsmC-like protein
MASVTTKKHKINGIRTDELNFAMDDLKNNADTGKYKFRAVNKWLKGARCETVIKDFWADGHKDTSRHSSHVLYADEPTTLLGHDKAANATEILLHALGSCLNASFIFQATAQGIKIDSLEFELEGQLDLRGFLGIDESVKNGFESICVVCRVKADEPQEKLEELCQAAQNRSPVFDMITHPVPVYVKLETLS